MKTTIITICLLLLGITVQAQNGTEEFEKGYAAYQAKNYTEALNSYKKAAEKGSSSAMLNIGVMYNDGTGVTKNENEAFDWYKKAAEKGNSIAMVNLAIMYYSGAGRTGHLLQAEGNKEAIKWLEKAAEKQDPMAFYFLGNIYIDEYQDYDKAKEYLDKAVKLGSKEAEKLLEETGL